MFNHELKLKKEVEQVVTDHTESQGQFEMYCDLIFLLMRNIILISLKVSMR